MGLFSIGSYECTQPSDRAHGVTSCQKLNDELVAVVRRGRLVRPTKRNRFQHGSMDFRKIQISFRKFRSRNMVPTGYDDKTGDNHLVARTVPEGRRYHSQIGKLVEKAKAPLLPDLENFATARTIHPHPMELIHTLSCSLARSRFTRSTCGAPGQPLPLGPPESGSLHSDRCLPLIHHGLFPLYLGYAKEKKMCSLIARYIHLFKQKTRVTILDE